MPAISTLKLAAVQDLAEKAWSLVGVGDVRGATKLATAASVILVGLAALQQYVRAYRMPSGCYEAPGFWLGCLPLIFQAVRTHKVHDTLLQQHEEHGDTLFLSFGLLQYFVRPIVITRDAKNVEYMLKRNFDNYPKGEAPLAVLHELLGGGIFNTDGLSWLAQRKTASQMFTAKKFSSHIWHVVEKNTAKVVQLLEASEGQQVDIFNIMNRFTLDSIGEIGFGASVGSLEKPDSPFLKSFDEAQRISFKRFILPGWWLFRLLGIGPEKESRRHFAALKEYSSRIVEELRGNLDSEAGDSFVGLFMKSRSNDMPCGDQFLVDMVLNFLIAGRDTTAQAMSWCLFLLMQHPEVEAKILQEIEGVCGANTKLTYDQLREFRYLEAVLNESLRLFPSVPIDLKTAAASDTLPDGTYISKGTMLCYAAYAMGRSERIWGHDAADFRPERWLELKIPKSSYENPAFHAGPRECLGKRLAMVEMKTVLVTLLRQIRLKLAMEPAEVLQDVQMTIGMVSGLKCWVEKR